MNVFDQNRAMYAVRTSNPKKKNVRVSQAQYSDFLCHYGIKGQKWGLRRYQFEDGSLTDAGKKRYEKYTKLADNHFKSAKGESYWRKQTEAEGKKYGEAWSNYGKGEARLAKAAIRLQNKANKHAPESMKRNMAEMLKNAGVEADKYSEKSQNKAEGEGFKAIMKSKSNDEQLLEKIGRDAFDRSLNDQERKRQDKADASLLKTAQDIDSMNSEQKRKVGDKVLERMRSYDPEKDAGTEKEKNFEKMERWIGKQVAEKSGTDTQIGSKTEANRIAKERYNSTAGKASERYDEIVKEIGYKWKPKTGNADKDRKQAQELQRLQNALNSDKVYSELSKQVDRAKDNWCEVVLKDIGFSNTPENRSLIWNYIYGF